MRCWYSSERASALPASATCAASRPMKSTRLTRACAVSSLATASRTPLS